MLCESVLSVQAHSGPIWRLSWAHPEFGKLSRIIHLGTVELTALICCC
jgi:hypothetical protein